MQNCKQEAAPALPPTIPLENITEAIEPTKPMEHDALSSPNIDQLLANLENKSAEEIQADIDRLDALVNNIISSCKLFEEDASHSSESSRLNARE